MYMYVTLTQELLIICRRQHSERQFSFFDHMIETRQVIEHVLIYMMWPNKKIPVFRITRPYLVVKPRFFRFSGKKIIL